MVSTQRLIKIKPILVFLIILFVVLGFVIVVATWNSQAGKYIKLIPEMKIDPNYIIGDEKYGLLRGAVFYKKGHFIDTSAKLVENNCNYVNWQSNGPLIDLNTEPHKYTLDDLGLPYMVYKKANSDTLYVEKKGCLLKFLIQ